MLLPSDQEIETVLRSVHGLTVDSQALILGVLDMSD